MHIGRLMMLAALCCAGCAAPLSHVAFKPGSNAFVPLADPDFVWEEVTDVVDDYFRIAPPEYRPQVIGNTITEGRLDTFPEMSATLLEPWRRDVATAYDRLEATFQTIRRRLQLRVIPAQGGMVIDVAVFKELEDLPRPAMVASGTATFRNEMSVSRFNEPVGPQTITLGWIPLGRDAALEQKILCKIQSRLAKKVGWPGGVAPVCDVPPPGMIPSEIPPPEALPPGGAPMVLPAPTSAVEPPRQMVPSAAP